MTTPSELADELENIAVCDNVFRPGNSAVPVIMKRAAAALRRVEKMEAALEIIAEEHDSGRHDGLPEPCPAHDADTMFAIARQALTGEAQ